MIPWPRRAGSARLAVALALLLATTASAQEGAAPAVVAAERVATLLAGKDEGALPEFPPTYEPPTSAFLAARAELPRVARALDAHLARSPRDARALVARGRLLRQQYRGVEYFATGVEKPPPGVDPRDEILALFDRAQAVDSTRTDVPYEKALTLASWFFLDGVAGQGRERFEEALPLAREAHRATPADPRRVDLLEHCLLATGHDLDAERVRDPAAGAGGASSPVARILARRTLVPAPPGLREFPRLRMTLGFLVKPRPGDRTAAAGYARTRTYQTESVSPDEILAFYRTTWPDLAWHDQRMAPEPQTMSFVTRFATAVLRWEGARWVPAGPDVGFDSDRTDILFLTIQESDFEQLRAGMPADGLAALPDSLRDRPLPATRILMIHDRVEEGP